MSTISHSARGLDFHWWVMESAATSVEVLGDGLPRDTVLEDVFLIDYMLPRRALFGVVEYYGRTYIGDALYCTFRQFLLVARSDLNTIEDTGNGFTGLGRFCQVQRDSIIEFINELNVAGDTTTARELKLIFTKPEDLDSLGILDTVRRWRALRSPRLQNRLLSYV